MKIPLNNLSPGPKLDEPWFALRCQTILHQKQFEFTFGKMSLVNPDVIEYNSYFLNKFCLISMCYQPVD